MVSLLLKISPINPDDKRTDGTTQKERESDFTNEKERNGIRKEIQRI
jgi:hypothetical protein